MALRLCRCERIRDSTAPNSGFGWNGARMLQWDDQDPDAFHFVLRFTFSPVIGLPGLPSCGVSMPLKGRFSRMRGFFVVANQSQLAIFSADATSPCSGSSDRQRDDLESGRGGV